MYSNHFNLRGNGNVLYKFICYMIWILESHDCASEDFRELTVHHPASAVLCCLLSFGKILLFISICVTFSPSDSFQRCVVKQPR
jgi:hypothetical protein